MSVNSTNHENTYYITETCYVLSDNLVLVNNGKKSKQLAELPWNLLWCLMQRHGVLVKYEDLYIEIWGDTHRRPQSVSTVLNRLKEYFYDIGVSEEDLNSVFITSRGKGLTFIPHKPVVLGIRRVTEALRTTQIPENHLVDIIECMLFKGISGRMGREGVIALAKKNNTLAALELGELYYHGYVTRNHKADFKTACEWYEKAGNHPTALWTLGYCIMNNYYPVVEKDKIDYMKAKNYFMKALEITTDSGYSAAAYTSLGQLWEEGHFPEDDFPATHRCKPKNWEQAEKYYKKADDLGYHYATNRLGLHKEKESYAYVGNEKYPIAAFGYFKRSVDLIVDGYALNKLGHYFETGFGCEANPAKACECFMRGVDEVLEDDITGWNLFNAARVCANRIPGQPVWYYNLPRAFDLFFEALRKLPQRNHDKVLLEMLDILIVGDTSAFSPEVLNQKKFETNVWVHRYLESIRSDPDAQNSENAEKIRQLSQGLRIK